jgi:hypothetical protein
MFCWTHADGFLGCREAAQRIRRQTLSESVWRRSVRGETCGVSGFAPAKCAKPRSVRFRTCEICEMRNVRFRTCEICEMRNVQFRTSKYAKCEDRGRAGSGPQRWTSMLQPRQRTTSSNASVMRRAIGDRASKMNLDAFRAAENAGQAQQEKFDKTIRAAASVRAENPATCTNCTYSASLCLMPILSSFHIQYSCLNCVVACASRASTSLWDVPSDADSSMLYPHSCDGTELGTL